MSLDNHPDIDYTTRLNDNIIYIWFKILNKNFHLKSLIKTVLDFILRGTFVDIGNHWPQKA